MDKSLQCGRVGNLHGRRVTKKRVENSGIPRKEVFSKRFYETVPNDDAESNNAETKLLIYADCLGERKMITQKPTPEILTEWKKAFEQYKDFLQPNRKSGTDLLDYLQSKYSLTEIMDEAVLTVISENVSRSALFAEKLPAGQRPLPKAFYLENIGNGHKFYRSENKDSLDLWGGEITKIFVGVDLSSGFYMVEGSTMLWDELCAFQGVDEKDLENYVIVADYISALQRFGKLDSVITHAE